MGSTSNKAAKRAQEAEDKRRADIQATQNRIEGIFGSPEREADIQDFISATRGYNQQDLDKTKQKNDRGLKFALARGGLAGGSVDVDQNKNLSDAYLRSAVESERMAQGAGNSLRSADQQAKMSLFSQALGGLSMGTSVNNSLEAMRNNVDFAKNTQSEGNFDSFFSEFGDLFTASKKSAGERRQDQSFNTLYGPRPGSALPVAGGSP